MAPLMEPSTKLSMLAVTKEKKSIVAVDKLEYLSTWPHWWSLPLNSQCLLKWNKNKQLLFFTNWNTSQHGSIDWVVPCNTNHKVKGQQEHITKGHTIALLQLGGSKESHVCLWFCNGGKGTMKPELGGAKEHHTSGKSTMLHGQHHNHEVCQEVSIGDFFWVHGEKGFVLWMDCDQNGEIEIAHGVENWNGTSHSRSSWAFEKNTMSHLDGEGEHTDN